MNILILSFAILCFACMASLPFVQHEAIMDAESEHPEDDPGIKAAMEAREKELREEREAAERLHNKIIKKELEEEERMWADIEKSAGPCLDCPFGNGVGGCTIPGCAFLNSKGERENVPTTDEWIREPGYVGD